MTVTATGVRDTRRVKIRNHRKKGCEGGRSARDGGETRTDGDGK